MSERRLTRSSLSPHAPTKYIFCICEECGAQLSTMEEVREHRKKVHGNGCFFCDDCNVGFKTMKLLEQHPCLAEQFILNVFDKRPREHECKDTGSRKMIELEVKNDTLTILSSLSTCSSVDLQHATPIAPPPSHSQQSLDLNSKANTLIAQEHSTPTHTPVSDCTIIPRIPKPCKIVPNTGPSKRFSGAIREAGERQPRQRRHPSLRPNPPSLASSERNRVVPRYCPWCALFLLMSAVQFNQHKAAHKNRPRLAILISVLASGQSMTGASKAPAQVSHPSRLPASAAKSTSKPPTIVGAAKKTTITGQSGNACKTQQHQARNAAMLPAQTTKTCTKEIPTVAQLSCPGEPRYAVTAIIDSPEQPASSVSSASTTSSSLHPAPSVPLSTSPPEVITLDDDEPAMLLEIFKKRSIIRQPNRDDS